MVDINDKNSNNNVFDEVTAAGATEKVKKIGNCLIIYFKYILSYFTY